jgi:hypothetical protein
VRGRVRAVLWFASASGALLLALAAGDLRSDHPLLLPLAVLLVALTVASAALAPARAALAALARWLRARPILYWLSILLTFIIGVSYWLVNWQPTNGRPLTAVEGAYLFGLLWLLFYLLFYDIDSGQVRAMGARLSSSRLSGVMVTLTTITILFFLAEAYLRIFYITTDGYGFTAMNYHWYRNFYWGQYNSAGYRDYEPQPDAPSLTRIAIVGDSFAMGHGINDIDDTFPQLLQQALGDGYDVNVIAQSGWDTDIQLFMIQSYPYRPDIVVLSYYLNDIDYLLEDAGLHPDSRFSFPENPLLAWFILNYFVPNYLYYNLLQFTSVDRTSNHLLDLVNAHLDERFWPAHAQHLFEIIDWAQRSEVQLILLLWPHITALEASQPALEQVGGLFREHNVPVVDMTAPLAANPGPGLIVNRFDTHPGLDAQRLAAQALYDALAQQVLAAES